MAKSWYILHVYSGYENKIENDKQGYRVLGTSETYDFQILLPENGALGFSASTAYYFYVELT